MTVISLGVTLSQGRSSEMSNGRMKVESVAVRIMEDRITRAGSLHQVDEWNH